MAQQHLVDQGLLIIEVLRSHSGTRQSVGNFWTSDQPDADTCTHNIHTRQKSMPPAGFEPTLTTSERSENHALDRTAIGIRMLLYVGFWIISAIHFSLALHRNSDLWRRVGEASRSMTHNNDRDEHPCPQRVSKSRSRQSSRFRPTPSTTRLLETLVLFGLQSETDLLISLRHKASLTAFWCQTLFFVFSYLSVPLCQLALLRICGAVVVAVKNTWMAVIKGKQIMKYK